MSLPSTGTGISPTDYVVVLDLGSRGLPGIGLVLGWLDVAAAALVLAIIAFVLCADTRP
jgi:hypothetical protein